MDNKVALESMLKLVIGMQNKHGFTLIEILVVLFIIGITLGMALLAWGDFGEKRRIITAGEQFITYVTLVQQEAILEGNTLGLRIEPSLYQAMRLQSNHQWEVIHQHRVFRPQILPHHAVIHLEYPATKLGVPQIIFNAAGEMTPFLLQIGSSHELRLISIQGHANGMVSTDRDTEKTSL